MKHFYFCSFIAILFSLNSFGQSSCDSNIRISIQAGCFSRAPAVLNGEPTKVRIRCMASTISDKPLYILDGVIVEESELKNIDPNDIESISVLKGQEATTLFGSRGEPGIVIIRTKIKGRITIKDGVSGEIISGATLDIVSDELGQHKIRVLSDSLGRVTVNKITTGAKYDLKVNNIGYKTYNASINAETIRTGYSISLQRNYSDLKEVVVTSGRHIRCICLPTPYNVVQVLACRQSGVKIVSVSEDTKVVANVEKGIKFYPNPVSCSQQLSIEFEDSKTEKISLRLFSLDGKLVGMKEYVAIEGANKINYSISSQLASGAYSIQLIGENNNLIKTEKLIIQ
jgi:TonB-dependent SusC/RagA subfamily outer membrane receptor